MTSDNIQVLRSTVRSDSTLEISLSDEPMPVPGPDEVVIRVEASPINPSDLGMLLAGADVSTSQRSGDTLTASLGRGAMAGSAGRVGAPMPVGNEGAGTVVAAGSSDAAMALEGKVVAVLAGGMYATHRKVHVSQCLALPDGTTAEQGAACFVNPLTVLGMVETMRLEGHTALVHTAAASNLGQMLLRVCLADDIGLVNVVRRPEQADMLRDQGARWVCDSSQATFDDDLTTALTETGATIAFDAIGGGELVSNILSSMEKAASAGDEFNRYGSNTLKQAYIYGGLDRSRTTLDRTYGMSWSIGGWLLPNFLARVGEVESARLRQRVADEILTTFASAYTGRISLSEALDPDIVNRFAAMATGQKYLITPHR
jgi:NADPH:quinone reductase-like Zn-dependent oxidoreductase